MPREPEYHRRRRQDPAIAEKHRTYNLAYRRALSRLREMHRGQFAVLLGVEMERVEEET